MQFTALLAAVAAILPATAYATSTVFINNECTFPIFIRDQGMGGSVGPTKKIAAKTGTYNEAFRGQGSSILIGNTANVASPLTLEYSPNGSLVYYDLSNNAGNPFVKYTNQLIPSNKSCYAFDCAPNAANCYSNGGDIKVKTCSSKTNLVATICAS